MTEAAVANPVHDFIARTVSEHPVVVQILDHLGVNFIGVDVLQSDDLRDGIKTFSDWPTIPQVYVKGEFVGGSDIVREMFQSGELKPFLEQQGVLNG